ncbi:LamG-like jellyroll fold domain-containing protein [Sulfurovum sp.]|uniref:LamG-like jellyroll fold domain-containing protein n=1 Tax=Sulfurovum sp. TaxID=1969726 RepID=UPI0026319243|nr:LamG-like jellyroll fold domain-containing protein [Sulfurovum sp.]
MAILDILGDGSCKICVPMAGDWTELSGNHAITNPINVTWPTDASGVPFTQYASAQEADYDKTYVSGAGSAIYSGDNDWTLCLWVKEKVDSGTDINVATIDARINSYEVSLNMHLDQSGSTVYALIDDYSTRIESAYDRSQNWMHLALRKTGSTYEFFIDATSIGTTTTPSGADNIAVTDNRLFRGNDAFDMAMYRVFDRSLTDDEINYVRDEKSPPQIKLFDDVHRIFSGDEMTFSDIHKVTVPKRVMFSDIHSLDTISLINRFYDVHEVYTDRKSRIFVRSTN